MLNYCPTYLVLLKKLSWVFPDIENLAHHKYLILEDCLYYNLSQEADQETSKSSSLVLLPPTKSAGDKVVVNIHKTTLRQMWMVNVSFVIFL